MAEQQEKLKRLFNARSNLESELCNIHKDITDVIDRQDRRVNVERLVSKLKDVFSKLVQKNENYLTWPVKRRTQIQFTLSLSNGCMM